MTTLPKELLDEFEEDFDRKFYEKFRGHLPNWSDPSPDELKYWFKVYLSYIYSSARRQALTEAVEAMGEEDTEEYRHVVCSSCKGFVREYMSHNSVYGYSECCGKKTEEDRGVRPIYSERNEYRAEAIAKLTQLRDV